MSDRPNNPFAFPRQLDGDEIGIMSTQYGMTLRDWFAGQAPPPPEGFVYPGCPDQYISDFEWTREKQDKANAATSAWLAQRAAAWSLAYADAMLAARGEQPA